MGNTDLASSGKNPIAEFCEHGDEPPVATKAYYILLG
jgi:hypothetical protein